MDLIVYYLKCIINNIMIKEDKVEFIYWNEEWNSNEKRLKVSQK